MDYNAEARNLLRGQMASHGITLTQLAQLLIDDGVKQNLAPLSNKINRGKFPLAFFLHCMKVMGLDGTYLLLPKESTRRVPKTTRAQIARQASNVSVDGTFPPDTAPRPPAQGRRKRAVKELV
ncbi:DUF6471 domain-containing protein [Paraburkholderia strydomiana]|uniref:DUF6471 domain-containing protein n=1 Tax=Paraburkholderia strydomiana TaxID=1245417 RepID=UPI0038BA2DF5